MPKPPMKLWKPEPPITDAVNNELAAYPQFMRQLLFNRQVLTATEADAFLKARLLHDDDPMQLADMNIAVERIEQAIARHEPIAIYGDYDTDGVTATALLVQVLEKLGADVRGYIPNRFTEGYGLNVDALSELKERGVKLVVSVDCGIRSLAEADHAQHIGLDLIISDHHHVGDALPKALAVINPRRDDDKYPEKNLAGVGLAYKISQALVRRRQPQPINGSDVLDLVALGTVADLATLTGENRMLVRKGLGVIKKTRRAGVAALMREARLSPGAINAVAIGFALGPRLNAAGRLDSALAAYKLLVTNDEAEASRLAADLERQNKERQKQTRDMTATAKAAVQAEGKTPMFLFVASPHFNAGVVGLVASRLADEFYRPAAVAAIENGEAKGSARSVAEFHITEALDQCADLLERYGGHAAAAGFTLKVEQLDALQERLLSLAETALSDSNLTQVLRIDAAVALDAVNEEMLQQLGELEPCGYGNPTPTFATYDVKVLSAKAVGADRAHLKLTLQGAGGVLRDAIAFRQGKWEDEGIAGKVIHIAYSVEKNEWQGRAQLQLNVRDIQLAEG